MQRCSIKGDLSTLTLYSAECFGREALSRISSEARFANKEFQFRIFAAQGLWYIEGNPNATNLMAINGVALEGGARVLKTNDVIGLLGRKTNRQAMRIHFQCDHSEKFVRRANEQRMPIVSKTRPSSSLPGVVSASALVACFHPDESELQNIIVEGWKRFVPEIDITTFVKRTNWSPERIHACVQGALYNHPEIFYFTRAINLGQWRYGDGTLAKIALCGIQYDFAASEYGVRKQKFDSAVKDALSCVCGISDEVEVALRLHDHIVRVCDYDLAAAKAHDHSCLARTAYSALVRHRAVCEGYTMAYRHLLNAVGIVSDVAVSTGDSHVWNYVRIRGGWYHVDVTYDDPVCPAGVQQNPRISHRHFLMSDEKALKTGHHAWNVHGLPAAKDKHYDEIYKE